MNWNAFVVTNGGNVGIGTTAPQRILQVNQAAGRPKGIFISGDEYWQSGNGTPESGVLLLLGVNRADNRQLWVGDSSALGSPTLGFLRIQTGTTLPLLDATTGNGAARLPLSLGTATTNVGVGFGDALTGTPGSKLSVVGGVAVGTGYRSAASPANGLIVEGKVGVGTTAPSTALHVVGDITATGNIAAK